MTPQARRQLINFVAQMRGWQGKAKALSHPELTQLILDESGYTAMLQADRSVEAAGRLENLSELVRAMEDYETLAEFLEHVNLVMERDNDEPTETVRTEERRGGKECVQKGKSR